VNKLESGRCLFFSIDDLGAKLAVLEAVSEVGVNFADMWFAINKKVGDGGRKDWWSGRGAA